MGELLAFFSLILFSLNIIITKLAMDRLSLTVGFPISVGVNVLFSLSLFLSQILIVGTGDLSWNTKAFFLFLLAGFFSTYLGRFLFFETIARLGPTRASAFQISNPVFTIIIAVIFLNEKLTVQDLASIILIISGLFLVSYIPKTSGKIENAAVHMKFISISFEDLKKVIQSGTIIALLSSLAYALGNVVRGAAIQEWSQPILGGLLGAIAGLALHSLTNLTKEQSFWKLLKIADKKGVKLYAVSGVINISAQILVITSMMYISVSLANLITLSTPVIVAPLSFILFKNKEQITARTIIGIVLAIIGLLLIFLL